MVIPGKGNDMADATWRQSGLPFGHADHNRGRRKAATFSRTAALQLLGSVVYAARLTDGTIKIGWTTQLHDRLRYLAHYTKQDAELLAFKPGGYDDEQDIHRALVAHRLEGRREYYHPTADVMAVVNSMRADLGLPAA